MHNQHVFRTYHGAPSAVLAPLLDGGLTARSPDTFHVALTIPMCGTAGLWGPSCIANAELALQELNDDVGINGRKVEFTIIDSAEEAEPPVAEIIGQLLEADCIDAIVGMHISAVRQRIKTVVGGRVPYIYTPIYEGGEFCDGVFAIGDSPKRQLEPAIEYLHHKFSMKKWALCGNDYIYPRATHHLAKAKIASLGGELVYERYVGFNSGTLDHEVDAIRNSGADGVLISLVGQDCIDFNRSFGEQELHRNTVRLSCILEENGLLASGAENLDRLFCSSSYFATLNTPENMAFKEKYHSVHQNRAPMLNSLGQSIYEGFQFLASLMNDRETDWRSRSTMTERPITYDSIRNSTYYSNSNNTAPIYLAKSQRRDLRQHPAASVRCHDKPAC